MIARHLALLIAALIGVIACADTETHKQSTVEPFRGERLLRPYEPVGNGANSEPTIVLPALPERCETILDIPYAPFDSDAPTQYPDDVFTIPDEASPTGRRIHIKPKDFAWANQVPEAVPNLFTGLNALSGFSLSGEIFFELSAAVTDVERRTTLNTDRIHFVQVDEEASIVPFTATYGQDGHAIVIRPLFPLKQGSKYMVALTRGVLGDGSTCLNSSQSFSQRIQGQLSHPRLDEHTDAMVRILDGLRIPRDEVVGATIFTTHAGTGPMRLAAKAVASQQFEWLEPVDCETSEHYRKCVAQFVAQDYRGKDGLVIAEPVAPWTLTVNIWLPLETNRPLPVIMYGHGINSGRDEGDYFAEHFAKLGFAIVGTDSMRHGDHPTRDPASQLTALDVLGVSILDLRIDPVQLRGNFNQTILDYLQLLQLIRQKPDFDQDGLNDLNPETIVYFGVSLGGMLGAGFTALAKNLHSVILSVPGGHLVKFVTDMEAIRDARPLLETIFGDGRTLERTLSIAQSLVDAADPVTHAPHIFTPTRIDKRDVPNLMMAVSVYDSTVPPSTGKALARALGLPHLSPIAETVEGLDSDTTPARHNGHHDSHTMGFFQFDRISKRNGEIEHSDHASTPKSEEGRHQVRMFLESILDGDGVVIVDPYAELNTPPLSTITDGP